ncbi:carboxypeptidase regulatory-like domain-containing protein [Termitidicoccus mucosus]|uniref:TonB-dependent transporter Oar-like beta-barrel domain-containing protein n=1 Tax=Termitidicoccus mucosus TaxID=1184151 RepID=A0A178IHV9_9BACT|nr:hypothetical protein AW736_15955 [Opitutaceae bacterium TSB47]
MHKTFLKLFTIAAAGFAFMVSLPTASAQGIVSSGITGTVVDEAGRPLSGAAVTVIHTPSNTAATAITGASGRFGVSGLRVGGPYTVSATIAGYDIKPLANVHTSLGGDSDVTLVATGEVIQLERFVVGASINDLNAAATGASSVLDNHAINNMPTTNRSFADMMKTNPFVSIRSGAQVTALGMNNRYNSISIDGARQNDNFGLSSTGLFSLKNPFSLDALENFSIQLTPYDVTQSGFAGASINAVSKSGSNEFHGSAYYVYTSYKWQGEDVFGTTAGQRTSTFYERTWGATLGGPIIKDKLFFFVNYEKFSNPSGGATNPGFIPDGTVLSSLAGQFGSLPGSPNFGSFGSVGGALLEDEKKLVKIDWNITRNHRLTVRYSETEGNQPSYPDFRSTGAPSGFPSGLGASFSNGVTTFDSKYYTLAVNEEVWAAQLFSNWTPNLKTEFAFSKNDTTSLRSTPVNLPEIILLNVPGTSFATGDALTTNTALLFGTDYSSMGNGIISKTIGYSGNITYSWKDLTFKAGFDREETDFENLFRNGSYGRFVYNYAPGFDLATATPVFFARNVATEGFPGTDVSTFEQTGFFVQAKWEPSHRFNVTLGLRYDVLGSPIDPSYNPAFETAFGVRNDSTIDGADQFAPRLSFNYALDDERRIQLRGGVGVFLGRNPWVWVSNSYGNAGFGRFTPSSDTGLGLPTLGQYLGGTFGSTDPIYSFNSGNPMGTTTATTGGGDVAFMKPGLKLPTNMRGNFAVDIKLPFLDSIFSVEYIRTDVMEAIFYDQINLVPIGQGADGRTRFSGRQSTAFNRVYRFGNTDVGGSDYVAFSLDRPFKDGWSYNITYTRGKATEAQPGGSSTASSQWQYNIVFNQNQVERTRSDYEVKDRIQASISKEFNFFKRFKTTATLYYEGRSGLPYSYVYSGDLNGDGSSGNDTLAVPTGVDDPRFDFSAMSSAEARDAYIAFMQNSELAAHAGGYAPRNAFLGPWQSRLDLHLSQEIHVHGPVKVEVFASFINFGSWLSDDIFNYIETLGNPSNSNQNRVLGNASYGADGRIRPTVSLNSDGTINFASGSQFLVNNSDSRWRIQAGVRLKF